MKKRNLLVVALILLASPLWSGQLQDKLKAVVVSKSAAAVGLGCNAATYDFSSGDPESFEAGANTFCTADWTLTNPGSAISVYDTTYAHCGTHSAKITGTSGTLNSISADFGSEDVQATLRFTYWFSSLADWADGGSFYFLNSVGDEIAYIRTYNRSSEDYRLTYSGGVFVEYFAVAPATKYHVAVYWNGSGAWVMKCWDASGNAMLTNNGGTDYSIEWTPESNDGVQTISAYDGDAYNFWLDDIEVALDNTDIGGARACTGQ